MAGPTEKVLFCVAACSVLADAISTAEGVKIDNLW